MTSIVMTYSDRQEQILKTLDSFKGYKDFNVIIANDGSSLSLPKYDFEVKVLNLKKRGGVIAFNKAFKHTKGSDIVIIQNAECMHVGDVLGYAQRVTDDSYIAFGCYSEPKAGLKDIEMRAATSNDDGGWFNHPLYRPFAYHFCSAITRENLVKLNGFDERFMFGIGYDDDYFVHQIKSLWLKIDIPAEPYVIHQWHTRTERSIERVNKNRSLYDSLKDVPNYRAVHILTPDLVN